MASSSSTTTTSLPTPPQLNSVIPQQNLDVRTLLSIFSLSKQPSFSSFKDVWYTLRFNNIHNQKPPDVEDIQHIQTLYNSAMGYLFLNQPVLVRVGVVYTLFSLYSTQLADPKVKIIVTQPVLTELLKCVAEFKSLKLSDPYSVYRKMKSDGMFIYSEILPAPPQRVTLEISIPPEHSNSVTTLVDFTNLQRLEQQYAESKTPSVLNEIVREKNRPENSFNLINPTFSQDLKEMYKEYDQVKLENIQARTQAAAQQQQQAPQLQPTGTQASRNGKSSRRRYPHSKTTPPNSTANTTNTENTTTSTSTTTTTTTTSSSPLSTTTTTTTLSPPSSLPPESISQPLEQGRSDSVSNVNIVEEEQEEEIPLQRKQKRGKKRKS